MKYRNRFAFWTILVVLIESSVNCEELESPFAELGIVRLIQFGEQFVFILDKDSHLKSPFDDHIFDDNAGGKQLKYLSDLQTQVVRLVPPESFINRNNFTLLNQQVVHLLICVAEIRPFGIIFGVSTSSVFNEVSLIGYFRLQT